MDLRRSAAAAMAALACACDPAMLVGQDPSDAGAVDATVDGAPEDAGGGAADETGADTGVIVVVDGGDASPIFFTTSFEDGYVAATVGAAGDFTDFGPNGCYAGPGGAGLINPSGPGYMPDPGPAHTGNYSGAFTINTVAGTAWARCFLNNGVPQTAYYSAWFYILSNVTSSTGWSLLHWQRPLGDGGAAYLWDVSLVNEPDGTISPVVIDYVRNNFYDGAQAIDAGGWFHLEVYLQRSDADAGAFTMYLNDAPLVQVNNVSTDTSSSFGFHIGNYAQAVTSVSMNPPGLVLYVDDVTVATQYVQNDGGLSP
jgi:hypothetical protein